MPETFYLYRFLDCNKNIIYIGQTNSVDRRLNEEHFTNNGNLPAYGYDEVESIEYTVLETYSQQVAFEAILIAIIKPKYNKEFNDGGIFDIQFPKLDWTIYKCDMSQFKKRNSFLNIPINDTCKNRYTIDTGLSSLDKLISIHEGSITLISGASQNCKTALALNICYNLVQGDKNKKVLYINLKESVNDLSIKLLSMESTVNPQKILTGKMTTEEWVRVASVSNELLKNNLYFSHLPYDKRSVYDLAEKITQDFSLVIVDDVFSLDTDNVFSKDKTHNVMRILKALAIDKQIPILALAPISNSKVSNRTDKRPIIQDFDYDSLVSYSDNILLLYKNNDEDSANYLLDIIVAKNNFGDTGMISFAVDNDKIFNINREAGSEAD